MRFSHTLGLVAAALACSSFAGRGLAQVRDDPFAEPAQVDHSNSTPAEGQPLDEGEKVRPTIGGDSIPQSPSRLPTSRAALRDRLLAPTKTEFVDQPLEDVVAFLRDFHDILIEFDVRALDEVGVGPDTPITRNLSNVTLRTALDLILDQHDLTYVLRDNVLLITTKLAAENDYLEVDVYDLSPLVSHGAKPEEVVALLSALKLPAPRHVTGATQAKSSVAVAPFRNLLVVRASRSAHEQIGRLLNDLQVLLEKRGE
jgi:hypothetical protein